MIICSVCGDEVNADEKSCPGCGASLLNKKESSKNFSEMTQQNSKILNTKTESAKGGKNPNSKSESQKSISNTKLFYLVLFLVFIGALIVYSSGLLDTSPTASSSQQTDSNNPHAGVDLKHLEQINSLEAAVENNPGDKESLLQLAHLLNDSGFKDKAIERYIQYLKMDPKNADVWVDLGVCYFETGKNDDAISSMEKGLKINPKHQIANLNLGIVNLTAGNKEKAIGYWNKAIEINPTNEIGKRAKELIKTH